MTRSPLFYPLNRGMDADAGGAADLQTDVMRFMAILSLCLVAIFALVQSIPLAPVETPPPEPVAETAPEPVAEPEPMPAAEPPATPVEETVTLTRPALPRPAPREPSPPLTRPTPAPITAKAEPAPQPIAKPPEPAPVESPEPPRGFTLRFEDDFALTRLVARNEVGLYAVSGSDSLRMSINRGAMSFWPASTPGQFHEMDAATVPDSVVAALGRRQSASEPGLKWGVTLPAPTARELDRYLREETGGALVIGADGGVRLEH